MRRDEHISGLWTDLFVKMSGMLAGGGLAEDPHRKTVTRLSAIDGDKSPSRSFTENQNLFVVLAR
jgi:hypothetical protein